MAFLEAELLALAEVVDRIPRAPTPLPHGQQVKCPTCGIPLALLFGDILVFRGATRYPTFRTKLDEETQILCSVKRCYGSWRPEISPC